MIHFVRSDVTVAVNQNGEVEGIAKIQNTSENSSYWRNTVFPTTKEVNGNTYTIKNDMAILKFAPAYSLLTVTDENGQDEIIYSVDSM